MYECAGAYVCMIVHVYVIVCVKLYGCMTCVKVWIHVL